MNRISSLDALRGWFLITMTLSHLVLQGGIWIEWLHFRHLMFVESAQGFVFLSGLLLGIIGYRRAERAGSKALWASACARSSQLWCWSVLLVVIVMGFRDALPQGEEAFRSWLGVSGMAEPVRALAIGLTAFQPTFMDILPQYVLYILISPAVILAVRRGLWPVAAAVSAIVWMASQIGFMAPISRAVSAMLSAEDGQGLRMAFDPMGWQVLFVAGLILGSLFARGDLKPDRIFPAGPAWPIAAVIVVLFFVPLRLMTAHGWMDDEAIRVFAQMERRTNLGPVYVLNFAAAAWLLGWLMVRGAEAGSAITRNISTGIQALTQMRSVMVLGKHSLETYAWHVLLIYGLRYADEVMGPFDPVSGTVAVLIVFALLPLPALWLERAAKRRIVIVPETITRA